MRNDFAVMRCYICGTYHFSVRGSCPECGSCSVDQERASDKFYPSALSAEASRLRRQAAALEREAKKHRHVSANDRFYPSALEAEVSRLRRQAEHLLRSAFTATT